MIIKTYSVTHNMPRTRSADADAICQRVNDLTASNGDSLYSDRVQDELDAICTRERQAHYKIEIIENEGVK